MIHPRRLKGTPANIARYYSVGDYYTKGADEQSRWGGRIAEELGLGGKVDPRLFKELLAGQVGDQQLGRRRADGKIEHHPGWDFAVNAPKSVSIMALVAGDDRIIAAHERAVGTALTYLEEHGTRRRREKGEIVHETTGRLIFARFTEQASRELDPHLHTHVVVLNITNLRDGERMVSLETRAMFAEQMTAGQIYRNDLAHRLRELGYDIEHDPRSGLFEIRGLSLELIQTFSRRAEQIDAHARDHGLSGQAARRVAYYATRPPKAKVGLDTLHQQWANRSLSHRHELEAVGQAADQAGETVLAVDRALARRATLFGIRQAETGEAVNNLGRMIRIGLASHVGEVRLEDVRPFLDEHEARRKLLATRERTGDAVLVRGRTTRRTARMELAFAQHLAMSLNDARPIALPDRLSQVLEHAELTPAQVKALTHIATARDRVTAIHGVAGAGKSMLVKLLDEAAEPGTTLIAFAPTSSAAANLGQFADIESRTVASLLAGGGRGLTEAHVLILDEAGQLGNRQALRVLETSRMTGSRLILLGDNAQTGAIEQGKAFWLLQKMGLPTAQLNESMRQQTKSMKAAVALARAGDFAESLAHLDRVASGASADKLAEWLVDEWTRLKLQHRATTNILVLDNATRLMVNGQIREVLKREGAIAAQDSRLAVLTPAGISDEEKRHARFYSRGQVVAFGRDIADLGIAHDTEYRVLGIGRDANGRQVVRLDDEQGRTIRWDPRVSRVRHINVFNHDERDLAAGDRIQWRLVNKALDLKNADRGTVEKLDGPIATIRWDRNDRVQDVDLSVHKTWDHGYAETIYAAQSKTYARVYVLAPVGSPLVNGQNYYTAITRARFGVKLWTEDANRLAVRLQENSGEKTSALEGLGRLDRDTVKALMERHGDRISDGRLEQHRLREERCERELVRQRARRERPPNGFREHLAEAARGVAGMLDRFLQSVLDRSSQAAAREAREPRAESVHHHVPEPSRGPER